MGRKNTPMRVTSRLLSRRTHLYDRHVAKGGRMVEFAGWQMPIQYKDGIIQSHLHCRSDASLFDVSHMLQMEVHGQDATEFVESLAVVDLQSLEVGRSALSVLLSPQGTIIDDTMITREDGFVSLVLNAGCADKDLAHLEAELATWRAQGKDVSLVNMSDDHSLLALQGPKAAAVLAPLLDGGDGENVLRDTPFLGTAHGTIGGEAVLLSPSVSWATRASCGPLDWELVTHSAWKQVYACMATTLMRPPRRLKPPWPGPFRNGAANLKRR